jgi:hypothetical protein
MTAPMYKSMQTIVPNFRERGLTAGLLFIAAISLTVLSPAVTAQVSGNGVSAQPAFPDTARLIAEVANHQKEVEELITQYTCTYKTTIYTLDKAGAVRNQHTDTYYMTPTKYEVFTLHISHDGKPVSQQNLEHQQKEIEHKLQNYERKAEKGDAKPKDTLLFGDIILKSKFEPLKWEDIDGTPTVVYAFEPKAQPLRKGSVDDKIASDMKGKMWINPESEEIVRMEFTSVSPLGLNFLTNVKSFQGVIDQRKVKGEVWLPSRQDFVAQGRQLISGFRIRQVSEFSDYLKATTDVFQQIHAPSAASGEGPKAQD